MKEKNLSWEVKVIKIGPEYEPLPERRSNQRASSLRFSHSRFRRDLVCKQASPHCGLEQRPQRTLEQ